MSTLTTALTMACSKDCSMPVHLAPTSRSSQSLPTRKLVTDGILNHTLDVVGLGFRVKAPTRKTIARLVDDKGGITGMRLVREQATRPT